MKNQTNSDNELISDSKKIELKPDNLELVSLFKVIGGKWKILLIKAVAHQCPKRFGTLKRDMENLAQGTLTAKLRELERDGILEREVFAESPPRVEYKLTPLGKTLLPVIDTLENWWINYNAVKQSCQNTLVKK